MPRELQIVSSLVAGDVGGAAAELSEGGGGALARFVDRHGLRMVLRAALSDAPPREAAAFRARLPETWLDDVEVWAKRQVEKQRRIVREFERLDDALRADGVEAILLKGPYAAARFHGGLERRAFSDLDLLVPLALLPRAEATLETSGLTRRSRILVSRRLTTRFTHAFDYAGRGTVVDLHWRLYPHPSFRVDEAEPWAPSCTWTVAGRSVRVLPDAEELRFLLVSAFRDLERGAGRVKHLVDVDRAAGVLGPGMDWDAFLDGCRERGMLSVVVNVLHLTLTALAAQARHPALFAALAPYRDSVVAASLEEASTLLEGRRGGPANKRWALALYAGGRVRNAAWWAVSLPFRLAVHQTDRATRQRRRRGRARERAEVRAAAAGVAHAGGPR